MKAQYKVYKEIKIKHTNSYLNHNPKATQIFETKVSLTIQNSTR